MIDWAAIRAEFPALRKWTFLNTATFGQMPARGSEAIAKHLAHRDELACMDFLDWFDELDVVRDRAASLIGAKREDIAFVSVAAAGLALLVEGLEWKAGERVITLENEFPNNLAVEDLLARRGVKLVVCRWERFYDEIARGARAVIVSMLNYVTGFRPPLGELSAFCRARGTLLYVDGTQGLGALRFDVRATPVDMLVAHGYKWLLAPNGASFCYVSEDMRKMLRPNVVGWRSDKAWREVNALHHGAPRFVESAEKYEGGMLNFPGLYALGASLELMLEIGTKAIETRVMELAARARTVLEEAGGEIQYRDTPIISVRFADIDVEALALRLKERRILVSTRHGGLRVSTHFYNNEDDLERLRENLGSF